MCIVHQTSKQCSLVFPSLQLKNTAANVSVATVLVLNNSAGLLKVHSPYSDFYFIDLSAQRKDAEGRRERKKESFYPLSKPGTCIFDGSPAADRIHLQIKQPEPEQAFALLFFAVQQNEIMNNPRNTAV